ncbi:MAG: DUF512 domain-containing protein [Anaerolineae bacterium]
MTRFFPAEISSVAPRSAGRRCGLRPGDSLLAINGSPLRDAIDVQVYGGEPELFLLFEREGRRQSCRVQRRYGERLGLTFSHDIFDGELRLCRNRCEFCFVAQMAPGLRGSLYIRDDDYRLSFLHGNYITLTNLTSADFVRIEEQFLSPLYVSVHATEPDLRIDLMRNPQAGKIMKDLQRLASLGIEVHTQAVLVPERNDGVHLDRTITDLVGLYPAVKDLSVVPVGLTRRHAPGLRVYERDEASKVLDQLLEWQARLRSELGAGFVYASDEWYLLSGVPVPEIEAYDGLLPAMIENGVGMVRRFLDGREGLAAAVRPLGRHQTWVTGTLFAPVLDTYAASLDRDAELRIDVVSVANRFFGETVTVAGLLTVEDILDTLRGRHMGEAVVLPSDIFRGPERRSLDGATPSTLSDRLGRPVWLATCEAGSWYVEPGG